jgi:hypothetical protein
MSQLTHPQPQALRLRIPPRVWLAVVTLIAGAAIALFFVISGGDEATQTPNTAVSDTAAGIRYDGGPEEGIDGIRHSTATTAPPAGVRYDGGPEEGTRGAVAARQPGVRFDGGPEEGTAALTQRSAPAAFDPNSIKQPPGVRYDGGPEEGSRGPLSSDAPSNAILGTRYDGGPEEGSRGSGR